MALLDESSVPAVIVRADAAVDAAPGAPSAAGVPPVELSGAPGERVVDASVDDAMAIVRDAERHGVDPDRIVMAGADLEPTPAAMQRNDAANMAAGVRPAAWASAVGAVAVAVVVFLIALLAGVSAYWAVLVALAGALVGAIVGGLWGLYGSLVVHPGVNDRRGMAAGGRRVTIVDERAAHDDDRHRPDDRGDGPRR
jgi:hypothetical protein